METFDLHGLILCVSEDFLAELLCVHNGGTEKFYLHELILYVPEDYFSLLPCVHNVGIEISGN